MNSINLTGRLTTDPIRRETTNGVVAAFNLAVDGRGNRLWIDVEAWGHLAGTVATYLTARRHVAVTGRLAKKQYLRDGRKQVHVVVIADRIVFLDASTPGGATEPNGAASTERAVDDVTPRQTVSP